MTNGYTAYTGPSAINGEPIKAIVTGTKNPSANRKTGDMLQLWIMPATTLPTEALTSGADQSVCGACVHRPASPEVKAKKADRCYVNVGQAPNRVWRTSYPTDRTTTRNVPMRLGAWGDPAALPYDVANGLVTKNHTGYTHQWRTCDQRFRTICMASVDTAVEAIEAQKMGWRTFRVHDEAAPIMPNEIMCPASKEAGFRTKCAQCGLCAGTTRKAKNIAIIAH